jgi:hypothetical protein
MKLTWFGGAALRVYVGGQIVVVEPDAAPDRVDRGELLAGADRVVSLGDPLAAADPATWRPRPVPRLMDEVPPADVARLGSALLISSAGEPALVIIGDAELPSPGRWAEGAVIVLTSAGEGLVADVVALLGVAQPRLLALALDEQTVDRVVAELGEHLNGTGLTSLEPGLALEV